MTRQAQVGLFTILGIIGLVAILYTISDIGQRASGYKLPVHFRSAAGLRPAALVYMAGVSIGIVDAINLRPDFTTDVVLSVRKHIDIPVGSRFVINVPLTGEPNLQIVPPRRPLNDTTALTTYPHRSQRVKVNTISRARTRRRSPTCWSRARARSCASTRCSLSSSASSRRSSPSSSRR